MSMPASAFFTLCSYIPKLKSENQLQAMQVSAYPHMKPSSQKELVRHYERMGYDFIEQQTNIPKADMNELRKVLNGE